MRRALIGLMCAAALASASALASEAPPASRDVTDSVRALPKFRYFAGSPAKHAGRVLRWYYNPANEPPALAGRMAGLLLAAAAQWSRRCAIQFDYGGVTTRVPSSYDYTHVFGWGNAGASLALAYVRSADGTRIDDADIVFNPALLQTDGSAYTAAVHEIGHALGLAHSDKEGATMSGPPYSGYTYRGEPGLDDFEGCQALYNNPYCASAKPADEFMVEAGSCPAHMSGGMRYRRSYYCADGAWIANAMEREGNTCSERAATTAVASGTLKEYARESTGQYFITAVRSEQAALESGQIPGWMATGVAWPVWETTAPELSPVCRFYGDASVDSNGKRKGPDAHFYTADAAECAHVPVAFPVWKLESAEAFRVAMPRNGACGSGTRPVTRFFRPSGEPVHRYVTDGSQVMLMLARGWVSEGTVFCLPQ
jgi:hypothetical protein